jgi:hypothetical protein
MKPIFLRVFVIDFSFNRVQAARDVSRRASLCVRDRPQGMQNLLKTSGSTRRVNPAMALRGRCGLHLTICRGVVSTAWGNPAPGMATSKHVFNDSAESTDFSRPAVPMLTPVTLTEHAESRRDRAWKTF